MIEKRRRAQIGWTISLMIAVAFAEVISIGAVMPFLTILISPDTVFAYPLLQPVFKIFGVKTAGELLLPITILFIFSVIISNGLRMVLYWILINLAHKIGSDLSARIFRHILFQSYEYHLQKNSSESITILNKSSEIVGRSILPLMIIVSSSITLVAIVFTLILLNPAVVLICLISFGSIYLIIANNFKEKIDTYSKIVNTNGTLLIKVIQESLGGIRDVLIEHTQDVYCSAFKRIDEPLKKAEAMVLSMIGMPRFAIEGLGVIAIAILAFYLTSKNPSGSIAIPFLGVIALGTQRLLPILQQGYASWTTIKAYRPALADLAALMESPKIEVVGWNSKDATPTIFEKEIFLENISFSYQSNNINVLKGISLKIHKGSRIGIVGTTGSGKSTLLDLIMGLVSPTHGRVIVDDIILSAENIQNWRACIAHVPQHVFISDASIAENIALGIPVDQIDWERMNFAINGAQLAKTIETWGEGYKTIVGERGARLSGGQRQRIGIARALYKNAKVIIFDEATSALDGETESAVMRSIDKIDPNLTIIMVAHRLTTLESCDCILEIDHGVVKSIVNNKNAK